METNYKLALIAMATVFILNGCTTENNGNGNNVTTAKKIEKVYSGRDLQHLNLNASFTWDGERLVKYEEYNSVHQTVRRRCEISYVSGSNTKISELMMYQTDNHYKRNSSPIDVLVQKIIAKHNPKGNEELMQIKMVPQYSDDLITKIECFLVEHNTYVLVQTILIEYSFKNPVRVSLSEGEFRLKWLNGNISSVDYFDDDDQDPSTSATLDEITEFEYDNKHSAYSSISNPMLALFMEEGMVAISKNNPTKLTFKNIDDGEVVFIETREFTFQYDVDDYPTTEKTNPMGYHKKFEYKK